MSIQRKTGFDHLSILCFVRRELLARKNGPSYLAVQSRSAVRETERRRGAAPARRIDSSFSVAHFHNETRRSKRNHHGRIPTRNVPTPVCSRRRHDGEPSQHSLKGTEQRKPNAKSERENLSTEIRSRSARSTRQPTANSCSSVALEKSLISVISQSFLCICRKASCSKPLRKISDLFPDR